MSFLTSGGSGYDIGDPLYSNVTFSPDQVVSDPGQVTHSPDPHYYDNTDFNNSGVEPFQVDISGNINPGYGYVDSFNPMEARLERLERELCELRQIVDKKKINIKVSDIVSKPLTKRKANRFGLIAGRKKARKS